MIAHGYLRGIAAAGTGTASRGLRFSLQPPFHTGCGRTFSIHWDDVIPRCSLPAEHLAALVQSAHEGSSIHSAWAVSKFWISLTSAYRWLIRWKLRLGHIRTRLCLLQDPPGKTDFLADPLSIRHLLAACPADRCLVTNFQQMTQTAITG